MANIKTKKDTIRELLDRMNDEQFVDIILQLMLRHEEPTSPPLSKEEIQGIYEAMEQIEKGDYYTEEEIKQRFAKWLK